jgi:hypothetical protein
VVNRPRDNVRDVADNDRVISTFMEISLDWKLSLLYSLKYGKDRRCGGFGRPRPG